MVNFNRLRAFYQASKHLNFSMAAKKLFVTQPAVSSQVKLFENELGLKLRDRVLGKGTAVINGFAPRLPRKPSPTWPSIARRKMCAFPWSIHQGKVQLIVQDDGDGFDFERALRPEKLDLTPLNESRF